MEMITTKKQTPSIAENWLYKDEAGIRIFAKEVYLPDDAPLWAECTDEEKEEWEKEHPVQEEPEENI